MTKPAADIRPSRLDKAEVERNFADIHPPLSRSEALIEADRCYFCFDAPCTTACPTGIDIPGFIQKIRSDNIRGSAHTILRENIMGGMCARVCPTEVLCEEACVRNAHEDKPVEIGLLQRYATDPVFENSTKLFERAAPSGKTVAVVGGGPAGLSCAHRLAMLGHDVKVFNKDGKPGGLNEYGIAAYKTVDDFAQREVDYILSIGGIEIENGVELGVDVTLAELRDSYDAVFLGIGLGDVNELGIDDEDLPGIENAIDYIADLRQADDKSTLPVGCNVVVVGGGMTAIDIAVQSKRLGAERVDIVYRRGPEQMGASEFEQKLAQTNGVTIHHFMRPVRVHGADFVTGVELEKTRLDRDGKIRGTGETLDLEADVLFKAIGQKLDEILSAELDGITLERGKIVVDESQATSLAGVWAGGDCVLRGDDLTVSAVQHGKVAAIAIDRQLRS
ncbi:MAG: NAD(P)-dependent oxidoreductase [Gammaproteobacteria bacterium]|nr:NAD(P)-dependent oxidoreductase [Gammaproteobacteria bacterium]MDH3373064.1 NAD(P)-dependent oxidoreductase [Gammaproteobacteria bacterium]MDH3409773.1 NAD(P)-dependent oxidoreductase [Gammaproteobacteria bacterium]